MCPFRPLNLALETYLRPHPSLALLCFLNAFSLLDCVKSDNVSWLSEWRLQRSVYVQKLVLRYKTQHLHLLLSPAPATNSMWPSEGHPENNEASCWNRLSTLALGDVEGMEEEAASGICHLSQLPQCV